MEQGLPQPNRKISNNSALNRSLSPGDMVLPVDSGEQLYIDLMKKDPHFVWHDSTIGVVVETDDLDGKLYNKVKVLVDGMSGWTYSDYLRKVR